MEDIQPRHVIDRLENRWPSRLQQDAKTWVSNGCGPPISSHSNRRCVGHPIGRQARPRSRREVWAGLEMPDRSIWPHQRFRLGGVDAALGGSRPRHTPGG